MNKDLPSDENEINIEIDEIPSLKTRSSKEDLESYDFDETASIRGIPKPTTRPSPKDLTASHIAKVIVWAFCLSMGLSFFFAFAHYGVQLSSRNSEQEQIPDINVSLEIFKTVSAVMSGPLGFVLGFYFRESK